MCVLTDFKQAAQRTVVYRLNTNFVTGKLMIYGMYDTWKSYRYIFLKCYVCVCFLVLSTLTKSWIIWSDKSKKRQYNYQKNEETKRQTIVQTTYKITNWATLKTKMNSSVTECLAVPLKLLNLSTHVSICLIDTVNIFLIFPQIE